MSTAGGKRIGIDLGGTKIEGVCLDAQGHEVRRRRVATPGGATPDDAYLAALAEIHLLIGSLEAPTGGARASIGIGMPGSISPKTGRVQNANSTWLNGREFKRDLEAMLGREVRLANDANCFAVSEATDGAGAGARTVFGVILGTGCGGGIVIDGRLLDGPRSIGGEWGHNPLPWPEPDEHPGPKCWCGKRGCMETWVSGPALAADFTRATGKTLSGTTLHNLLTADDGDAKACFERHADRLARGLAQVTNIIDPDVIVLGGGLSQLQHLYAELPWRMAPYIFADDKDITIRQPLWGDASGVRGAAWLWA